MERYNIPQPKSQPTGKRQTEIMRVLLENSDEVDELWFKTSAPYVAWRNFEAKYKHNRFHLGGAFEKVTAEEAWFLLNVRRRFSSQTTPIVDTTGRKFTWAKFPSYEKDLHDFDMQLGGNVLAGDLSSGSAKKERFLRQSLIEEAIASSQLEGAATTRERAKKMLAENRKPQSHDEWMIYNNYQTIRKIEQEVANYPLSRETLLDLHELMTHNAIEEDKKGRWRKNEDEIVVTRYHGTQEFVAHVPPAEKQLQRELDRFIAFANDESDGSKAFIHPIVKAAMIHFWFSYLHPFCDGNGRLARSLFYWYLLRQNPSYWLVSYVPISTIIKKSPTQYADAFSFSEQHNNDITYFLDYHFRKLRQALTKFAEHVQRVKEKSKMIDTLIPDKDLNNRQKQVIHHLLGRTDDTLTVTQHAGFHEVGWLTASKDLKELAARGYLDKEKAGREVYYSASEKLKSYVQ